MQASTLKSRMARRQSFALNTALLCGMIVSAHAAAAQTFYGSVVGTVTDPTGAIVPGATVTLVNTATNEKHIIKVNSKGDYEFVNLVPSTYSVQVEAPSFKRVLVKAVPVEVNTTSRADAKLELGEITETVEVSTDTTAMLQTDSGTLSTKVEGQQVQEMPLNGRNVMNLLELAPGVIPTTATESQTGMNQGNGGTNPAAWNGFTTNGGSNSEFMDGAPLNVLNGNVLTLVPTQDSVQEFAIDTSAASPDEGRSTGGVVNMTSRSGTNTIHGSVYEYFRNADLNANNFFNSRNGVGRAQWNQNQYGAALGAPIKKDKIFFFGSWEAFRIHTGSALSTNVPTQDMQNGIFGRQITDPNAATDGCVVTHNPAASATYPNGTWTLGAACIDPTAKVMQTYWPLPNANPATNGGNNYYNVGPTGEVQNQINGRVDYTISPKQRIFGHEAYWHIQDRPFQPFPNSVWNLGQEAATINNNLVILGDTYTVSPKTVVDVRLTYLRFLFGAVSTPSNVDLSKFGANYAALQAFVPAGQSWIPQPSFSGVHGLYSIGNFAGLQQHWDTYGLNGNVTRLAGRHSLKIGGEARLMDAENGYAQFATGNTTYGINFTGNQNAGTGDEYAEFLLGDAKTGTFGGPYPTTLFNWYQGYYINDTWSATRKLTVTLGLRYELPGGVAEKKDKLVVLEPTTTDPYTGVTGTLGLVNSPIYGARTQAAVRHNLFDPRLGFAYRATGNTVVRGGYGITNQGVDLDQGGAGAAGIAGAVINTATATFTNVAAPNKANTLSNPFPQGVTTPPFRSNPAFMTNYLGTSISSYVPYFHTPYIQEWNLTVEQQIKSGFVNSISYVGTHAVHLAGGTGLDELSPSYYPNGVPTTNLTAKVNGTGDFYTPKGQNVSPTHAWTVGQSLMPYPYYTNFANKYNTYASQHYNALQVSTRYRIRSGGQVGAAFTWAKTIGDNVNYQNYYNHKADKSVEGVPMRLVLNYVLPLPFGQGQRFANFSGIAGKLVSGWEINGITSFQHGGYIAITESSASILAKSFGAGTTRSNYLAGCNRVINGSAVARLTKWFNTSCFSYAGDYAFGNETANDPYIFGQGQDNWDIAAAKTTHLTERFNFIFKIETFNTFNRFQAGNPGASRGSATFGQVTSQANNPRLVQLSARISF